MGSRQLRVLFARYGGECHYCGEQCNRIKDHPKQATKDHVVPKALGGTNTLDNYVLACQSCNNDKGTTLFYCMCSFHCAPRIHAALADSVLVGNLFYEIIQFNRVTVSKNVLGEWSVKRGYSRRSFDTWEEAIVFAHKPTKIRRNDAQQSGF